MKNKIFTLFLAVLASVGMMSAELIKDVQIGELSYNLDVTSKTAEVTSQVTSQEYYIEENYSGLTTANIPDALEYNSVTYTVTSIGDYAFHDCRNLVSVTIPKSVTSIGRDAFEYCSELTSVTIPNSVTSFGELAFSGCRSLTNIKIPNSVTNIGGRAFDNCSLTSIEIPQSVTSIGEQVLSNCDSLVSIRVESENPIYDSRDNCNAIIETATNKLIAGCHNSTIPNGVTSIGNHAFYFCSGLANVTIPNSVTSIGENAFYDCSSLTNIIIPNNVTSIGKKAFAGCSGLISIRVENGNSTYDSRDNCNAIIETASNTLIAGCQNTTIPNNVTSIGGYAFWMCRNLTSIGIPSSVTSIGECAFYGCRSLSSIEIPNRVTILGREAFTGCNSLKSVHISDLVAWCGIAFSSASSNPLYNAHHLYLNDVEITDMEIPNSITFIEENAFYGCSGLTSVKIPNNVTSIGDDAFRDCSGLTNLTIPNSITRLKSATFWGCSGLTSITCEAVSPPTCDGNYVFYNVDKSIPLYVPAESIGAYKKAIEWKTFTNILPIPGTEVEDTVPSDAVLANYYNTGDVCVCIYVPAEMNCNDIVLTGSFNGWSTNITECAMFEPVAGYDGWHVTSFTPEEELDAEKGIQAKPIMLDSDGRFNWSYQAGAATVIRGGVQVVANAYSGEIDLHHYSAGTPNVFKIDAWKDNPCTSAYHNYKFTVISDGCEGYVAPFIVASFTNWTFTQMNYDVDASTKLGADVYSFNIKAAEGSPFQFVSGMWNDEGYVGVQPSWSDDAYIQILGEDGLWRRIHGEEGDNLLTHESAEIVMDIRPDNIRWARCAPAEKAELVIFGVKLPAENCPEAVEVIGTFDGWQGTALTWNPSTDFFEATFEAKATDFFKFRTAGTWEGQEFELYNEELDAWEKIAEYQYIFGQLWEDIAGGKSVILDLSNPEKYRWSGTTEPTPCLLASGTCGAHGDNLTWVLSCDSVLTISGKGKMDNHVWLPYIYRDKVKTLVVNEGVTNIERFVFTRLTNLISATIPNSVTRIEGAAFCGLDNLTSIEINGNITFIGDSTFMSCRSLTSIEIPNGVTSIGNYAFEGCTSLTSIEIPNSVTSIGGAAFGGCTSLTSIEIPNSVTSIGSHAFNGCTGLTSITCEATTPPTLESEVFNRRVDKSIPLYVPAESIDLYKAADQWKDFTNILPIGETPAPCLIASGSCADNITWELSCDSTLTIAGTGAMTSAPWIKSYKTAIKNAIIEDGVTNVYWAAFYYCSNLKSVTIGNGVTQIEGNAFYNCSGLSNVTIGNNVISIGNSAFSGCRALTAISLPNSLTTIGDWAFSNCRVLTSVTIPQNVATIGQAAFGGCFNLTEINVVTENSNFCSVDGVLFNKNVTTLVQYPGGGQVDYIIPNSVTAVAAGAFWCCRNLTSIKIPSGVTTIGDWGFDACSGLTSITCEAVIPPTCGADVFYDVDKSIPVYIPAESVNAYISASYWSAFTNIRPICESDNTIRTISACSGYWFNDEWLEQSGIYHDTLLNHLGCDSIIELHLTIHSSYGGGVPSELMDTITIVKGDPVIISNGITIYPSETGYQNDTMRTIYGCDSIVTHYIIVTEPKFSVIFLDYNSNVLSEQKVENGKAAQAPQVPTREGYTFVGWNVDIEHIVAPTYAIALYDKIGGTLTYLSEEGDVIATENVDLHLPAAPIIAGKSFKGWLTESADSENGIVLRATYTFDNPTTHDDVTITPSSNSAYVIFPFITGALTYQLVIRDLFGNVVCKIMFSATGHLLGIAFAPSRNRESQQATQTTGFNFTVEGLDANTTYEYEFVANDDTDEVIETLSGSFTTTAEVPTDNEQVNSPSAVRKYLEDGHLMIDANSHIFNTQGKMIK